MEQQDVIAATRAWVEKAVIGLNLCPFAKAVYVKNQVRLVVSEAPALDTFLEQLVQELEFIAAADPLEVDTTLLMHPTLFPEFLDFNMLLPMANKAVARCGLEGVIQIASFHPDFQFADSPGDDITNYTNRAPYPTLHLIREASIDKAVAAFPEAEAIYLRNMETLQELGLPGWQALGLTPEKNSDQK